MLGLGNFLKLFFTYYLILEFVLFYFILFYFQNFFGIFYDLLNQSSLWILN
jgi:hypothetical protein